MGMWMKLSAIVLVLVLPGCMVSKTKYEAAVSDMESAKAELEKMRMHRDALEQQMKSLKGEKEELSTDLELSTAEVQRLTEGQKGEQALLQNKKKELESQQKELQVMNARLVNEYKKLKSQNAALKETVVRYQKELKANREKKMAKVALPSPKKEPIESTSMLDMKTPVPPKDHMASAPKKQIQLININHATATDLILHLGLSKEVAHEVVANRPYRLRGELVAKQVVPKATFDAIKDRITAAR
ncbi:MAG: helix-hairpin-helix domain-containing protein [Nitrospirales bacterium]|nr:helix-hairpin-helix domain-containing protein [Nitrospira sp.]MDR4500222.1 helix-hairpin-helix domain-containing protein [Nitrospirales bacterium]